MRGVATGRKHSETGTSKEGKKMKKLKMPNLNIETIYGFGYRLLA